MSETKPVELTEAERDEITRLFGYVPDNEPLEFMLAAVIRIKAAARREAWDEGVGAAHRSPLTLFAIKQVNPYLADTTLDRQRAALAESPRTGTKGAKP